MTIYNINKGLGWASSGVEYAQAYRAKLLNRAKIPAKFIFTDMFTGENIQHLSENIGFQDDEVIWLYQYFSDIPIAATTYTINDFKQTIRQPIINEERNGKIYRWYFSGEQNYCTGYLSNEEDDFLQRVEFVQNGILTRKDYYSFTRVFSEYYLPHEKKATVYQRRFFNQDGTTALEEIIDESGSIFLTHNQIFDSKEKFIGYFIRQLNLTANDIIIIDRATNIAQAILENKGTAKVGTVVHAEHFSESSSTDKHLLWNNYYEYQFTNRQAMDFFITATETQKNLLNTHFARDNKPMSKIFTIPVGALGELVKPTDHRSPYAILTASRLAEEKHIDWLIKAVAKAKETLPQLTFDIYGEGGSKQKLLKLIEELDASDYIQLKGHADLKYIYKQYELYLSASTSEGFGLTLMEAVGSGLPIIGFDVRYGNITFINDGENGYLLPFDDIFNNEKHIQHLSDALVRFYQKDIQQMQQVSYALAEKFLEDQVQEKWENLVKELLDD
ncbi:accessory Sec system glycosyltransferase GtfA [Aerococcus viridans]|uniref:UDP-N-acetylglucosamine--peptide N-acetylglucosaminyltransferase GtfA subunit n=1 Tax=Aerococcus viridans TaxID=1377 RepID=A0A2J9PNH0_9LACT|nr:accessory Sec system glycosyltransferase GtfA [Aerococcus viridans]MCT1797200.1 accessory Sec system glycosyltransferase GtfA [Aerococcus viridans]PNL91888.1 accessory Sec system glycosyltransferase GtfA [Aerococcus viridans]